MSRLSSAPRSMPSRETIALLVTSNVRRVSEHGQPLEAREAVAGEVKVSERVAARPEHRIDVHPGQPAAVHARSAGWRTC